MKKLGLIMVFILALTLLVGCDWAPLIPGLGPEEPVDEMTAEVEMINWIPGEEIVTVNCEITNTGTVDIDFYEILFEVEYIEDSVYKPKEYYVEGIDLEVGECEILEFDIEDILDEVAGVKVLDLKLAGLKM